MVIKRVLKRGIYIIEDEYFCFYYCFVSLYYEDIEGFNFEFVIEDFRKNFNIYLGIIFEKVVREFLIMFLVKGYFFSLYYCFGCWWYKGEEIDFVVFNECEKKVLFVEVKWKEFKEREVRGVLKDLERKVEFMGFDGWEKSYGFVVKSVEGKEEFRDDGWLVWDLGDFERFIFLKI